MVRVRARAKINLALEVLNKRPDGFHNIRTIFQTISLYDSLGIEFRRARKTFISINSDIPDNLVVRAAHLLLDEMKMHAAIDFHLTKRIPMGAGLGGGSSDAAAVLRALPALAGREVPMQKLIELGAQLGSDVPFFLIGGCALGLGRGTELYPLPDPPKMPVLLVAPQIHVSTPQAYKLLNRSEQEPAVANHCQSLALALANKDAEWWRHCCNDFEAPVFVQHPEVKKVRDKLRKLGAVKSMMTGSGSAVFGVFDSKQARDRAQAAFGSNGFSVELVRRGA